MISTCVTTRYIPSLLNKELADELFLHLKENVEWEDGIYYQELSAFDLIPISKIKEYYT